MYTPKLEARLLASFVCTLDRFTPRGSADHKAQLSGGANLLAYGTASAAEQRHWPYAWPGLGGIFEAVVKTSFVVRDRKDTHHSVVAISWLFHPVLGIHAHRPTFSSN